MTLSSPTLGEWLREAPFSLCMSSGFFAFFAHTGVLSVLVEEGILPARVSGSSAGALVTGAWAGGVEPEALAQELLTLRREDFWDPAPGFGLLRGRLFREKVQAMLAIDRIEQCRTPLTISVFEVRSRTTRVLDRGPLADAICASCAVPGLFHPVTIDGRAYWDGGVADRPGMRGVPEGERVLFHHIVSRSPWRKIDSEALKIPRRANMATLVIDELPRSGPFRLDAGRRAFHVARERARRALREPIRDAEVHV